MLMLFYSIIFRLSDNLPWLLDHNQPFSLHLGDFVLSMFLFTTGMALYFMRTFKWERWARMFFIWFLFSPFSSGKLFGMDELVLNALLSLLSFPFINAPSWVLALLSLFTVALYPFISLSEDYLGGYPAAIFYWPVMLCGILAARNLDKPLRLLLALFLAALLSLLLFPPYKMSASPSFMLLSALFSLSLFSLIHKTRLSSKWLETLGRFSLYYWSFMLVLLTFISLAALYYGYPGRFSLSWQEALFLTLLLSFLTALAVLIWKAPEVFKKYLERFN